MTVRTCPGFMNQNQCTETGGAPGSIEHSWCNGKACGFYQNGGYWSTPRGWLLPAVARANFSLAADVLQAALNDSFAHGFNEAVNHEAHYNPPQKYPPQTCEFDFDSYDTMCLLQLIVRRCYSDDA